jgi:hypothetical protein
LSKDGKPLPDGSRGAIPLDPETGNETTDAQILAAFSELMNIWQYQQYMSLRPKMAAILGDCLTELVDDTDRGIVAPNTIYSGYIPDLELDYFGNVKAYAVEYQVSIPAATKFGKIIKAESYQFRKEVDGEMFRYFKDNKPFDYSGEGAEIPNPYGFCPAVWDRHEIVAGQDRGIAATERTIAQTMQFNSVLSHAMAYQEKQFAAPIGIIGRVSRRGTGATLTMPGGITSANPTPDELIESQRAARENINLIELGEGGQFVNINFDVGKTREMLDLVMESILAENPEARYGQEILQMTQVTGPGMERVLSPIVGLVNAVRANIDPQTVKLLQMGTAIMGERLKRGDYPVDLVNARPDRYDPFKPFDLTSHGRGLLKCSIPSRPVFEESRDEKIQRLILIEGLQSRWAQLEAGMPEEEVDALQAKRQAEREGFDVNLTGIGGQNEDVRAER